MEYLEYLQVARRHFGPGLYLVLAVVLAELLNLITFRKLNKLGIVPREPGSVAGIVLAHLLHSDFRHFLANLAPLTVLAFLLGQWRPGNFWWVAGCIALASGALVWLLARRGNHLGASGLVYGLFGYLALGGFLSGKLLYVAVSAVLLVLYSGILWGALPLQARASWESHLAGLCTGLALAWFRVF